MSEVGKEPGQMMFPEGILLFGGGLFWGSLVFVDPILYIAQHLAGSMAVEQGRAVAQGSELHRR